VKALGISFPAEEGCSLTATSSSNNSSSSSQPRKDTEISSRAETGFQRYTGFFNSLAKLIFTDPICVHIFNSNQVQQEEEINK
jgi:hypothetical protein